MTLRVFRTISHSCNQLAIFSGALICKNNDPYWPKISRFDVLSLAKFGTILCSRSLPNLVKLYVGAPPLPSVNHMLFIFALIDRSKGTIGMHPSSSRSNSFNIYAVFGKNFAKCRLAHPFLGLALYPLGNLGSTTTFDFNFFFFCRIGDNNEMHEWRIQPPMQWKLSDRS